MQYDFHREVYDEEILERVQWVRFECFGTVVGASHWTLDGVDRQCFRHVCAVVIRSSHLRLDAFSID